MIVVHSDQAVKRLVIHERKKTHHALCHPATHSDAPNFSTAMQARGVRGSDFSLGHLAQDVDSQFLLGQQAFEPDVLLSSSFVRLDAPAFFPDSYWFSHR